MPGTRPGRSAMPKAMKPDRIGTSMKKAILPSTNRIPAKPACASTVSKFRPFGKPTGRLPAMFS